MPAFRTSTGTESGRPGVDPAQIGHREHFQHRVRVEHLNVTGTTTVPALVARVIVAACSPRGSAGRSRT